jgi:hypothetical protein
MSVVTPNPSGCTGVLTGCCDKPFPTRMTAAIKSAPGSPVTINVSAGIAYDPATGKWKGDTKACLGQFIV